jgi:D-alanyl-D-alanine carboxypeptidase
VHQARNPKSLEARIKNTFEKYQSLHSVSRPTILVANQIQELSLPAPNSHQNTFLAASITKIFTSTLTLKLQEQGVLSLSDPLEKYLTREELAGLVTVDGKDLAGKISLEQLLSNRSGIPDYYKLKALDPKQDIPTITRSDPGWSFDEVLELAKTLPNELARVQKKASYSFTNFQILSEVLERATDQSLGQLLERNIFGPAGLNSSFLLEKTALARFDEAAPVLFGTKSYLGAARIASLRGEGALVSTTSDLVAFMRKLQGGELVSDSALSRMQEGTRVLFPFVGYGLGMMRVKIPGVLIGAKKSPELFGHFGATGSFAFWEKTTNTYIAGSVNQMGDRRLGSRFLLGLAAGVVNSY